MNKQLQILLLIGLATNAYSQYYGQTPNTCPVGQYPACDVNSGGYGGGSTATSAPPANQTCVACPKGSAAVGSSSYNYYYMTGYSTCQICQAGYYANKTGQITCTQCPEGFNCADPSNDPVPAPKGFFASKVWNLGSSSSLSYYGYDYYSYQQQSIVRPCPTGTYANKLGQPRCTSCPAGNSCADPTAAPVPCPKGTASSPYGYSSYSSGCQQCPQGTYASSTGASTCTPCPEGSICPDQITVIKCPVGTYGSKYYKVTFPMGYDNTANYYYLSKCLRCPQGQYQTVAGSTSCTKCPKGYYCSDPTVAPKACPVGTYSNFEYGVESCPTCPPGTYSTTSGSKQCTFCPKGSYCANPAILPIKCPIGTFSNSTVGQALCTPCPPGTYANTIGSVQCQACPANKCCNDPTIAPQPCYMPSTSTPLYQYTTY